MINSLRYLWIAAAALLMVNCGDPIDPDDPDTPDVPETFSIGGEPVASYILIYNIEEEDNASKTAALEFRTAVKNAHGVALNITPSTGMRKPFEVIVGNCGASWSSEWLASATDPFDWAAKFDGGKLMIVGASSWALKAGVKDICDNYVTAGKSIPADELITGNCRKTRVFEYSTGTNLRIMTYNIWQYDGTTIPTAFYDASGKLLYDPRNENRSKDFAAVFYGISPDVLGMQEYSAKMNTAISGYISSLFKPASASTSSQNYTPIYYNSKTLTLKSVEYKQYSSTWSNGGTKSYTVATFEHKATGKQFIVLNTHLWWKSESAQAGSDKARLDQVNIILKKIEDLTLTTKLPVFVMGDMNCKLGSDAMNAFVTAGYHSAAQDAIDHKDGTAGYHYCAADGFKAETEAQKTDTNGASSIDHIWFINTDANSAVRDYHIVHTSFTFPMADHAPRFVDVAMK